MTNDQWPCNWPIVGSVGWERRFALFVTTRSAMSSFLSVDAVVLFGVISLFLFVVISLDLRISIRSFRAVFAIFSPFLALFTFSTATSLSVSVFVSVSLLFVTLWWRSRTSSFFTSRSFLWRTRTSCAISSWTYRQRFARRLCHFWWSRLRSNFGFGYFGFYIFRWKFWSFGFRFDFSQLHIHINHIFRFI